MPRVRERKGYVMVELSEDQRGQLEEIAAFDAAMHYRPLNLAATLRRLIREEYDRRSRPKKTSQNSKIVS